MKNNIEAEREVKRQSCESCRRSSPQLRAKPFSAPLARNLKSPTFTHRFPMKYRSCEFRFYFHRRRAFLQSWGSSFYSKYETNLPNVEADYGHRETPVGYALLRAKSSKILKREGLGAHDESAEEICSLCVMFFTRHLNNLHTGSVIWSS